jgi:transposase
MAAKPKPMSQIKQILRFTQQGKSIKFIARSLSVSRNTVRKYLSLQQASGQPIEELLQLEDNQLEQTLTPAGDPSSDQRYQVLLENYDYFCGELRRRGVTRWLLWSEYRQSHPGGYCYSQFCKHLQDLSDARNLTMANLPHPPGEQTYIDFAGNYAEYVDPGTGQVHKVPVLVLTLGYSQYSYVEALRSQAGEDLVYGLRRGFSAFGGVTSVLIPDNMKSAVVKTDRYEPGINRLFEDLANHYNTAVMPARPRRPKDKPLVESAVRDVYRHVFAPLRNRTFYSLEELNQAIAGQLRIWHDRPFQGREESRRERFEQLEQPALQALPAEPFLIKKYASLTIRNNCHIQIREDRHYYSAPYGYARKKVQVIYTPDRVQIFCKGTLIAAHQRDRTPYGYTTVKEHLPENQRHWMDRGPGWYRKRAHHISPEVGRLIDGMLASKTYPEQTYRSCDGILGLHRKVGSQQLTQAARIALELDCCTYSFVNRLIQNGMATPASPSPAAPTELPAHDNIRGKIYFQQSLNLT